MQLLCGSQNNSMSELPPLTALYKRHNFSWQVIKNLDFSLNTYHFCIFYFNF